MSKNNTQLQIQKHKATNICIDMTLSSFMIGIIWNLENWKRNRQFALHTLWNDSFQQICEDAIREEAQNAVKMLEKYGGGPFIPRKPLRDVSANVQFSVFLGQKYVW